MLAWPRLTPPRYPNGENIPSNEGRVTENFIDLNSTMGRRASSKGCYVASSNPANHECPNNYWFDDEIGSCRSHQNSCPVFSVDVKNNVRYEPPKYTTEEECNLGRCSGGYGELAYMGLWTKEDCQTYSKQFCDRHCPKCIALGKYSQNGVTITYNSTGSTTYPSDGNGVEHMHENEEFRGKGNGACFDSSNNLVTDRRYANGPDECMSGNKEPASHGILVKISLGTAAVQ